MFKIEFVLESVRCQLNFGVVGWSGSVEICSGTGVEYSSRIRTLAQANVRKKFEPPYP